MKRLIHLELVCVYKIRVPCYFLLGFSCFKNYTYELLPFLPLSLESWSPWGMWTGWDCLWMRAYPDRCGGGSHIKHITYGCGKVRPTVRCNL